MSKDSPKSLSLPNSAVEFLIFTGQAGDDDIKVRYQDQTIWLTQKMMAELFGTSIDNISLHLKNIYVEDELQEKATTENFSIVQKLMVELFGVDIRTVSRHLKNIFDSGELETDSVIRKFRITASDGKNYNTQLYNLDAIKGYVVDKKRFENGAFLGEMDKLLKGIER